MIYMIFIKCVNQDYKLKEEIKITKYDEQAYKDAITIDSLKSYDEFLRKYSESKFAPKVYLLREKLYFDAISDSNTLEDYNNYLKEYPKGKYIIEVNEAKDKLSYEFSKQLNTPESYYNYLKEYPDGKYVQDVKTSMENYYYEKTKQFKTLESYNNYLKNYPKGKYVYEVKKDIENYWYNLANKLNTFEMYDNYLSKYPNGHYVEKIKLSKKKIMIYQLNNKEFNLYKQIVKMKNTNKNKIIKIKKYFSFYSTNNTYFNSIKKIYDEALWNRIVDCVKAENECRKLLFEYINFFKKNGKNSIQAHNILLEKYVNVEYQRILDEQKLLIKKQMCIDFVSNELYQNNRRKIVKNILDEIKKYEIIKNTKNLSEKKKLCKHFIDSNRFTKNLRERIITILEDTLMILINNCIEKKKECQRLYIEYFEIFTQKSGKHFDEILRKKEELSEMSIYEEIKATSNSNKKKQLCSDYLSRYLDKGIYLYEVLNIYERTLWKEINEQCNIQLCNEYLNNKFFVLFSNRYKKKFEIKVINKMAKVEELNNAKELNLFKVYRSYTQKYKTGKCSNSIIDRTKLRFWKNEPLNAHTLTQIADIYWDIEENFLESQKYYKEAIKKDNLFVYAYEGLGLLYSEINSKKKALEYLKKAEDLFSNNYEVYYNIAKIHSQKNDKLNAIKYFDESIKKNSKCIKCFYFRAITHMNRGKRQNALIDFKKVIEIVKSNKSEKSSLLKDSAEKYIETLNR